MSLDLPVLLTFLFIVTQAINMPIARVFRKARACAMHTYHFYMLVLNIKFEEKKSVPSDIRKACFNGKKCILWNENVHNP